VSRKNLPPLSNYLLNTQPEQIQKKTSPKGPYYHEGVPGINALPLIFGHRGYSSKAPENSLAAFQLILSSPFPGVELDIQETLDGELVIHHDWDLVRTAGISKVIASSSWDEIKSASIGWWYGSDFSGETLPRLSDLFELGKKGLYYDIEIKEQKKTNPRLVRTLGELIKKYDLLDHVIISSFNPLILREFSHSYPKIPRAAIYSSHPEVPWYLRGGLGSYIAKTPIIKPHYPIALKRSAQKTGTGKAVMPWTVNNPDDAYNLGSLGVWALISDDPGIIAPGIAYL
jgi:glycerophosphoryl diester phosphodiesterase